VFHHHSTLNQNNNMLKEMRKAIKSIPSSKVRMSNTMKTTTPMMKKTPMPVRKMKVPAGNKIQVGQKPAMSWKKKGYKPSNGVGVGM